jgi:hypothetical protein
MHTIGEVADLIAAERYQLAQLGIREDAVGRHREECLSQPNVGCDLGESHGCLDAICIECGEDSNQHQPEHDLCDDSSVGSRLVGELPLHPHLEDQPEQAH